MEQAPPSPEYVPDLMKLEDHVPVYVSEPDYPEYLAPSDDDIPVKDQPLPVDASPIALSPGYIADSDPEEDGEDLVDYPADAGDDDDDESSVDNDDDDDDVEEDEEEEEHLAHADSTVVGSLTIDHVPSIPIPFPFEEEEMEPDIENMTMNEYLEYEAVKERQLIGAENMKRMGHDIVHDRIWEQDDDSKEDQEEDGDYGEIFYMWDITTEDVERIRKFFNIRDEIDKIVQLVIPEPIHTTQPNDDYVASATKSIFDELLEEFSDKILNVAIIDEEADFNPTKDLEELERLLAMRAQSNFMEIQVHSVNINIHTQLMSPLNGVFKTSKPCKVDREVIYPGRLKHAKLILGYRDTCEIRIRLIPC
ncbi:hypothetical protein Tco_0756299 [Tanacetum coccineum]